MKKLVSAPVFRLKGSGWYETDFKSDQDKKRNLVGDDKDTTSAEAKPVSDTKDKAETKPTADAKTEKASEKPAHSSRSKKTATKPKARAKPPAKKK
jgi:predicted nucleic acid-binding Zn ribbon protein